MRCSIMSGILMGVFLASGQSEAQALDALPQAIQQIMARPEYRHSQFGLEVLSLDTGRVQFALDPDKLFIPASTMKVLTEGTALEILGPDFRFHTRVYRTGPIKAGTVEGNLVLVASGDPNISGRVQSNDVLAFENSDHAYDMLPDAAPVPGDPLIVLRKIARQIVAHGIKAVEGEVLVDISLFSQGEREPGTGVIISPIAVNDNLIDVKVVPGAEIGAPTRLIASPSTSYVRFVNQARTGAPDVKPSLEWTNDITDSSGIHMVTVTGEVPLGKSPVFHAYEVQDPQRFAEIALAQELRAGGAAIRAKKSAKRDFHAFSKFYTPEYLVAEHVSPPLMEDAKVTLKVSQNLHAAMMPFDIGVYAETEPQHDRLKAGFVAMRDVLQRAGLDLSAVSAGDGAGGSTAAFTPDFLVQFLRYMSQRPYFPAFHEALPILGRDGSIAGNVPNAAGAGHVFAKSGTGSGVNLLAGGRLLSSKALAGYIDAPSGGRFAFALFVNKVPLHEGDGFNTDFKTVGDDLAEITSVLYQSLDKQGNAEAHQR